MYDGSGTCMLSNLVMTVTCTADAAPIMCQVGWVKQHLTGHFVKMGGQSITVQLSQTITTLPTTCISKAEC